MTLDKKVNPSARSVNVGLLVSRTEPAAGSVRQHSYSGRSARPARHRV